MSRRDGKTMPLLIGETYRHAATGRLLVVVDHEWRRAARGRKRTGRLVVRPATGATWSSFVVKERDLAVANGPGNDLLEDRRERSGLHPSAPPAPGSRRLRPGEAGPTEVRRRPSAARTSAGR